MGSTAAKMPMWSKQLEHGAKEPGTTPPNPFATSPISPRDGSKPIGRTLNPNTGKSHGEGRLACKTDGEHGIKSEEVCIHKAAEFPFLLPGPALPHKLQSPGGLAIIDELPYGYS